ncbi:MAG: zinc-binding protein [Chromatiaceae bacterium]|nr:MAG: zinc-binding protein [Chromatiaceae bacterium]
MAAAIDGAVVRAAARGRWDRILPILAPELEPALARPGRHGPCPLHGGQDGFRVFRDVAVTGGGICNTCGARPDGFALLMWLRDWNFHQAAEAVAGVLGLDPKAPVPILRPPRKAATTQPRTTVDARSALRRVWANSLPVDHPGAGVARRYLERRGICADLDPRVVRLHPRLAYYDSNLRCRGHYPALVSRFFSSHGTPIGVHRTYLEADGRKALVAQPKKMMVPIGSLTGGALRLFPAGPRLGIAEGLETALAVRMALGWPMWAATTAVLLERWMPPPGVVHVGIFADLDRSRRGQEAAAELAEQLRGHGLQVTVFLPDGPIPATAKGLDWADVFSRRRPCSTAA